MKNTRIEPNYTRIQPLTNSKVVACYLVNELGRYHLGAVIDIAIAGVSTMDQRHGLRTREFWAFMWKFNHWLCSMSFSIICGWGSIQSFENGYPKSPISLLTSNIWGWKHYKQNLKRSSFLNGHCIKMTWY